MNKKDFKQYMKQGLGRCTLTLKSADDIEKYKEIVLWGCLHNLSFDTQSEGTRAAYVYELTSCYDDADYFVLPVIKAFQKIPRNADWLFTHYCELLRLFAKDGNSCAQATLQKKYNELLITLIKKHSFHSIDYDRDKFEQLCISMTSMSDKATLLSIINDIGTLFMQNKNYDGNDFAWFLTFCENTYGKKTFASILKRKSKKSDNIRYFYERYCESGSKTTTKEKTIDVPSVESIKEEIDTKGKISFTNEIRFIKRSNDIEKKKLAKVVLKEQDLLKKAELLSVFAFGNSGFPLSHDTLIEYSESTCERLSEVALEVLTDCNSSIVRDYAYELLARKSHISSAIQMLLNNYDPKDKELLLSEIYKLKVDYEDESEWHDIGLKILNMYDAKVKLPKEFLLYVYNTTLCSYCRGCAVSTLAKHKWLTADLIEECRYDSNSDISKYINRYYPI